MTDEVALGRAQHADRLLAAGTWLGYTARPWPPSFTFHFRDAAGLL